MWVGLCSNPIAIEHLPLSESICSSSHVSNFCEHPLIPVTDNVESDKEDFPALPLKRYYKYVFVPRFLGLIVLLSQCHFVSSCRTS